MPKRISESDLARIDARRICIVKPSAFGDVVQTLPLLPALKERFPGASISWVVADSLAELLEGHPCLDEMIAYERHGGVVGWLRLLSRLRQGKFDLALDLQGLARSAVMNLATRAKLRLGLETAREGARFACHFTVPDSGRWVPAHLRYWRVAEVLGVGDLKRRTHVSVGAADLQSARQVLEKLPRPVLAINPGARWTTKRWPVEKFAAVAAKAQRRYGFSLVAIGGFADRPAAGQLCHLAARFVPAAKIENLAGKTTLKQLAAVLHGCDVMLTGDSGPMHLAAGLGTPVVGVFTCTDPVRSGPPGEAHELVACTLPCAASYKKKCPYRGRKHLSCMDEVSIERVWAAVVRLVEKRRARRAA